MLSTLRNAWKVPDLRKRLLWTVFIVAIYRLGSHIPVPGIDTDYLKNLTQNGNSLWSFYDLMSGGALSRFSILALGVVPYINSSIIMQLLTIAIPPLEQLSKEGEEGRKKIQKITRYASIGFGLITAYGTLALMNQQGGIKDSSYALIYQIILTLTVGSVFCMWLGDQITVKGIGNGISLIIFINIVSRVPSTVASLGRLQQTEQVDPVQVILLVIFILALLAGVIYLSLAERRVTVQYAGKAVGNKMYKGQSTHIPLSLIGSAVIAIIFAMSVMQFPQTVAQLFPNKEWAKWIMSSSYSVFNSKTWMYAVVYALLTIFFTWFYTQVTFKPDEMAENMNKSAGFVPGIRPGKPTEKYLERMLTRVSLFGGLFAAFLVIVPIVIENNTQFKGIAFGPTSILILVGVALDVMRTLESQLVVRHYQGFLK
ncbi:preprotein translocase subunit SecY [Clostridium sp. 'White wine YQ']|uniref:preprotein translocase subunit SecY n=1 Tax=Clostridium sp. 'White wine YQ' TaxID=3027474 RepID=UPI002366C466|nr:preprotein translocase subunit SecY [Clostridium sp. 'White wine YQ']MDD7795990.1 preprotein translocase subunit SecY [Clostridium sp. 'White wine YQ']